MSHLSQGRESSTFKLLYPLAFLGAHLAFMPLLLLLLPRRVELLAPDDPTSALSWLLILGAVAASIAHIAAGHWSDGWMARHGTRRAPVVIGLILVAASYGGLAAAGSIGALATALVAFQLALNLMFAPLGALLSDYVADASKARMAARLSLALPLSVAATGAVGSTWPDDSNETFLVLIGAVAVCVLPLICLWPASASGGRASVPEAASRPTISRADFRRAWLGRFLVQCGAALLLLYLYVYLRQLPSSTGLPHSPSEAMSMLSVVGGTIGVLSAFAMGQVSDWSQQRRWPIASSAAAAAGGLFLLSLEPAWHVILLAYAMFSAGLMAFLSIDSAMVAQMLGSHPRRGRWLGIMNLTNTLPAIVAPLSTLFALQIASENGIAMLLATAACATLLAAALILRIGSVR